MPTTKTLTAKQERFCQEYLIDLNCTQAAIRAGYSIKTAGQIGEQNYKKLEIQKRIQELQAKREKRTEITADKVLKELATIGFANVTDFVKVEKRTYMATDLLDPEAEPVEKEYKAVDVFETDAIAPDKIPALASIKQGKDGIEVKMHDKVKALELMAKHLGMFTEKVEHDHKFSTVPTIVIPQPKKP